MTCPQPGREKEVLRLSAVAHGANFEPDNEVGAYPAREEVRLRWTAGLAAEESAPKLIRQGSRIDAGVEHGRGLLRFDRDERRPRHHRRGHEYSRARACCSPQPPSLLRRFSVFAGPASRRRLTRTMRSPTAVRPRARSRAQLHPSRRKRCQDALLNRFDLGVGESLVRSAIDQPKRQGSVTRLDSLAAIDVEQLQR